jgi:hypothetical protein
MPFRNAFLIVRGYAWISEAESHKGRSERFGKPKASRTSGGTAAEWLRLRGQLALHKLDRCDVQGPHKITIQFVVVAQ